MSADPRDPVARPPSAPAPVAPLLPIAIPPMVRDLRQRRAAVRERLESDALLILRSSLHADVFAADPDYFYLTGLDEPDGTLVLTAREEILYLPSRDVGRERWETARAFPGPIAADRTGIEETRDRAGLDAAWPELLKDRRTAYIPFRPGSRAMTDLASRIAKAVHPESASIRDARPLVASLRQVKSPLEIGFLKRAAEITCDAHRAALARIGPGLNERQLHATLEFAFREGGGDGPGYPPIVGSGPNACILHYRANGRDLRTGELVLIDAGCRFAGYAADVTRTYPVDGRFTPRQRRCYDWVLRAHEEAAKTIRPGIPLKAVQERAVEVIQDGLLEMGYIRERSDYRAYLMHGTSHFLGLEVHDAWAMPTLAPGMVFTIEPGIYVDGEEMGIRIEDDYLVTETGGLNLTAAAPRIPEEIEALMAKKEDQRNP